MIKKYFALSVVAASVAIAGCSSDDNTADPVVVAPIVATPGVGGTAFDFIATSDVHSTLQAAIEAAGLDDALDNPANLFTIFAPTNAAFEALDADGDDATPTTADLLADTAALTRVLQYHVLSGDVSSAAVGELIAADTAGEVATLLEDGDTVQTLAFTLSDTAASGVAVNGIAIDVVDQVPAAETETQGRVHVIGSVLIPPPAPVVDPGNTPDPGETPDPGTTPEPSGAVDTALANAGGYTIFRNAINRDFGGNLDSSAWTVFVPSDAVLGAAGLSDLTAAQQQNHIVSSGANDPATLAGLSQILSSTNSPYAVATSGGVTTVNGFAVELIATGAGGAQIYSIAGILTAP